MRAVFFKKLGIAGLIVGLLAAVLASEQASAADPGVAAGDVVVLPIEGPISRPQLYFLRRTVKQANAASAAAIILNIDTPGGELATTEKICKLLLKSEIPIYSYINTNAASAGALIAMATKGIYMAPVSAIGAAAPVMGSGQEMGETMTAKVVSYYSGYFRSVAVQNGYNPELVDAFMNLDKEVKVGEEVLNPKGSILTLSAQEAVEEIDGKPVLASGIADSLKELVNDVGLDGDRIVEVAPSGFETVAQWITLLAPAFLLGGIVGTYLEFKSPGFGVAGILAGICFLLFFGGHYIAGLTGYETLFIFLLGVILVLVEFIFFPGLLIPSIIGFCLMLGAAFFAMVDFAPTQKFDLSGISIDMFMRPALNLAGAVGGAIIIGSLLARFLPEIPLFKHFVLQRQVDTGPAIPVREDVSFPQHVEAGAEGQAITPLRPAGRALFNSAVVDVVTDGEFLTSGTQVRVLRAGRDVVLVEKMQG